MPIPRDKVGGLEYQSQSEQQLLKTIIDKLDSVLVQRPQGQPTYKIYAYELYDTVITEDAVNRLGDRIAEMYVKDRNLGWKVVQFTSGDLGRDAVSSDKDPKYFLFR